MPQNEHNNSPVPVIIMYGVLQKLTEVAIDIPPITGHMVSAQTRLCACQDTPRRLQSLVTLASCLISDVGSHQVGLIS